MKVSIIAAMDKKRGIGKDNKIPWHISEDFKRFKQITTGHSIIMGRKTWDCLPFKPLPNRTNIIVTQKSKLKSQNYNVKLRGNSVALRNSKVKITKVFVANSIEGAIEFAKKEEGNEEVFIIGGGQVYEQAVKKGLVDKLYLTIVDGNFDADTFFPDYPEFKKVISEESKESEGYKYTFLELERYLT